MAADFGVEIYGNHGAQQVEHAAGVAGGVVIHPEESTPNDETVRGCTN